jgi:hypothetical protein
MSAIIELASFLLTLLIIGTFLVTVAGLFCLMVWHPLDDALKKLRLETGTRIWVEVVLVTIMLATAAILTAGALS